MANALMISNSIESSYLQYTETLDNYEKYNVSLNIDDDYSVITEGNNKTIKNPLKFDLIQLAINLDNVKSGKFISSTLEYFTFVFGTYIFSLLGAYIATYDYEFQTLKNKCSRINIGNVVISKSMFLFFVASISSIVICLVSFAISFLLQNQVAGNNYLDKFKVPVIEYDVSIIQQILFVVVILTIFAILGFTLANIVSKMSISIGLISIYLFVIPVHYKYDIRNIISYFAHKIFYFNGKFTLFDPMIINEQLGLLVLVLVIPLMTIINISVMKKKRIYR